VPAARHEAANLNCAITVPVRPCYGRTQTVGLGHNRSVRYDKPLAINAHTIVSIQRVPVDILHTYAVGKRAARALAARETLEARLERRISKPAVVA
jgi:hypothetical protein